MIRPIRPDDKQWLRDAFARLSPEWRYGRFFTPDAMAPAQPLRRFTEVDHHSHEAMGAPDPYELTVGARDDHVERFSARALADNEPMLDLLRGLGDVRVTGRGVERPSPVGAPSADTRGLPVAGECRKDTRHDDAKSVMLNASISRCRRERRRRRRGRWR